LGISDEHHGDDDRRKGDRRVSQEPVAGKERRQGERRSKEQLREDYDGAVSRAKAALLTYGMDSPEFAEAARATEDISWQIKEIDRAADPDSGS
jgi:ribosome-binding protein aMBF1 (putative translation factor)